MSEEKRYLLSLGDVVYLHGLIGFGCDYWREFLEPRAYKERTCHDIGRVIGRVYDDLFVCSECKAQYATRGYIEDLNIVTADGEWAVNKYCPNCGAKVVEQ